jgi:hypothetical protein
LNAKKITIGYKTSGFAIYKDLYAGDDVEGLITLYKLSDKSSIANVRLPDSPLAGTKASAFSSNGKWLAVSGRSRGAVWKLETGERVGFSRDFEGAFFDQEKLIAKFPRRLQDSTPAQVAAITLSPISMTKLYELEAQEQRDVPGLPPTRPWASVWQDEDLLVRVEPTDPKKADRFRLDVRDVRTNSPLWQFEFEKRRPRFYYLRSGKTITFVVADYDKIKEAARHDSVLSARIDAIGNKQGKQASYLVQVFDARAHEPLGNVIIDTGNLSFYVERAVAAGGTVFVADSLNRTLVYSLKSGEQRGKVFGRLVAVSESGDRMLVENGKGVTDLYDASSLQSVRHFAFPSRIARAEFSSQNKLLILTADQTVYQFDLAGSENTARQ